MSLYADSVSALTYPKVARTVPNKSATSLAAFKAAIAALQPGDWLAVKGATLPGEVAVSRTLTAPPGAPPPWAKVTFDAACKFTGFAAGNLPALFVKNSAYLQFIFQGCAITNPGGVGILQYASHHLVFDGYKIHGTGGSGFNRLPVGGDIHDCFYRGEIWNIGLNHAYDPHDEKGSGMHCSIVGDSGQGHFRNNIDAIYGHDTSYSGGSVLQVGDPNSLDPDYGNQFYVKAERMHFVSKTQTGGNAVNGWGYMRDNVFKVVEASDLMGFAWSASLRSGDLNNVVERGSAVNCCQNPRWKGQSPWQKQAGVTYKAVTG